MLGIFVFLIIVVVIGLGVLGGCLLVAMKRRIDEDRALDDANSKRQEHSLKDTNQTFIRRLGHLWSDSKAKHDRLSANFKEVGKKVGDVSETTRQLEEVTSAISSDMEGGRMRLNDHAATLGSEVARLDSVDTELGNRIGDLEVLAPVVKRMTIDEDGIKVCGFNSSSSTMCRKIKFAAV